MGKNTLSKLLFPNSLLRYASLPGLPSAAVPSLTEESEGKEAIILVKRERPMAVPLAAKEVLGNMF